ncbi:MAG: AtpZ/AtpI family protein [Anaerolineae bacterium]|nr:AtpZ/AtpI family protein [Anaerolineae bacterium]
MTLAVAAGQVGCLTLVIIFLSLFGGLWLDNQFSTRPLFTILLLVGSIPVTLVAMFWVVRKTTAHIKPASKSKPSYSEEADREK